MKYVELVMVTVLNNNKYYKMEQISDDSFTVRYGRVGGYETTRTYSMYLWDTKYREKVKKGYKDVTELRVEATTSIKKKDTFYYGEDTSVKKLLKDLMRYSSFTVDDNYSVSADDVTDVQIAEAQDILNKISVKLAKRSPNLEEINKDFIELYTTIPRKMAHVSDYLPSRAREAIKLVADEQSLLDTMDQQVAIVVDKGKEVEEMNVLDSLGIKAEQVVDDKVVKTIKNLLGNESNRFIDAWEIKHKNSKKAFSEQLPKSFSHITKLLWHGSRNQNWLNILRTGLLIRPTGVITTGTMFGNGIYFADKAKKSMGYCSLSGSYWARGSEKVGYLALFEVNVGVELKVKNRDSWMGQLTFEKLRKRGNYDSLYALKGYDLYNSEFIVYQKAQCTIKYIVKIGEN